MNHVSCRTDEMRKMLSIHCAGCKGLCCRELFFSKSDGFPADKPAGKPCAYLMPDFRCGIHNELEARGMKGCMAYDCFGAGQAAAQSGGDFHRMFRLRQMLWYLLEAADHSSDDVMLQRIHGLIRKQALQDPQTLLGQNAPENSEALLGRKVAENSEARNAAENPEALQGRNAADNLEALHGRKAAENPEALRGRNAEANQIVGSDGQDQIEDIEEYQDRVNEILKQVIDHNCEKGRPQRQDMSGMDFRGKNLSHMDFTFVFLIAANLSGCKFHGTSLLGADLRDARLDGADLSESLFLTQGQINGAVGNEETRLPPYLTPPESWRA